MSAFTESAFSKKLAELNSSQQSIQTLSLWLIHHRKHHAAIVKTWIRELQSVSEDKKLTYMFLANDVIQNSKKKGPEYGKQFSTVLPKVFTYIGEKCKSEKLIGSLGRILNIWEERGVYDSKTISEYRARLNKEYKESNATTATNATGTGTVAANNSTLTDASSGHNKDKRLMEKDKREKRKHDEHKSKSKRSRPITSSTTMATATATAASASASAITTTTATTTAAATVTTKSATTKSATTKNATTKTTNIVEDSDTTEVNGNDADDSYVPLGDPPEPEELIKALENIENSASSDAAVRERIANLPEEVSIISCLNKIQDKDEAKALEKEVSEVVQLLNEYNKRLAVEMEERSKLSTMLRNFQAEQKDLLVQAEKRLDVMLKVYIFENYMQFLKCF